MLLKSTYAREYILEDLNTGEPGCMREMFKNYRRPVFRDN